MLNPSMSKSCHEQSPHPPAQSDVSLFSPGSKQLPDRQEPWNRALWRDLSLLLSPKPRNEIWLFVFRDTALEGAARYDSVSISP